MRIDPQKASKVRKEAYSIYIWTWQSCVSRLRRQLSKMKFGHNLPRNQVPEWAASYINYKGLKKLIKTAAEASKDGSAPDLAGKLDYSSS